MTSGRLPRPARRTRQLLTPPPPPAPHRTPLGPDTLRAAYGAHMAAEHAGHCGTGCRTCRRYLDAVIAATALATVADEQPTP